MPDLPHLIVARTEQQLPRRKKPGMGAAPARDYREHGTQLSQTVENVLRTFQNIPRITAVNPDLILRVELDGQVDEDMWSRAGLSVLSIDENRTLVLFASDRELREFRNRLEQYRAGPPANQKNAPHNALFGAISNIGLVEPRDRIGRAFRREGITDAAGFIGPTYTIDIELWHLGDQNQSRTVLDDVQRFIVSSGGRVSDDHIGTSLILIRAHVSADLLREILTLQSVATVDMPPRVSLTLRTALQTNIGDFPPVAVPTTTAKVAILDSGITAGHPLLGAAVGEATSLVGADGRDDNGHGTMVAGIAIYGDVEQCIADRDFTPEITVFSVRVLNEHAQFGDDSLITTYMTNAVRHMFETYGCRVFNLSLGDDTQIYADGKVSYWAAILDSLARELNVTFVVSAGNYQHPDAAAAAREYPQYLLDPAARIVEPATACTAITVGALARRRVVPVGTGGRVQMQPLAHEHEPSPFTRTGPGLKNAIKPEFCAYGGNHAYDGLTNRARELEELSVVSLHNRYLQNLFTTGTGTSYAAPAIAHLAAVVADRYPDNSANLVRALLASSALVPVAAGERLSPMGEDAVLRVCGYGQPDLERAVFSQENRVVLLADDAVGFDNFHVYEIPIPQPFVEGTGERRITVALAFDPPVRHTRIDYLGATMSFRLIRGQTLDEVIARCRQRTVQEGKIDSFSGTSSNCDLRPGANARDTSTLQRATFRFKRDMQRYGNTYHLVVNCERQWAGDEFGPQRYALAVVLEQVAEINLYEEVRQQIQVRLRARQRG